VLEGKAITVTSINGPDTCIIDGPAADWGVRFEQDETNATVVSGITYRNINGTAFDIRGASPVIHRCVAEKCITGLKSNGLEYGSAFPVVLSCTFDRNTRFGLDLYFSGIDLVDCVVTNNGNSGITLCNTRDTITVSHCLIAGNGWVSWDGSGVRASSSSGRLDHCTIAGNRSKSGGGGIYLSCDTFFVAEHCIISDNIAPLGSQIYLGYCRYDYHGTSFEAGADITLKHTAVPDRPHDIERSKLCHVNELEGVIRSDPLLVSGPLGDHYLSHTETGEYETSPCFDAGTDAAAETCFDCRDRTVCLDTLTTRTDAETDTGMSDLGYHYPPETECRILRARLSMPYRSYHAGRSCFCDVTVNNPGESSLENIFLLVVLDVAGQFYFAPSMTEWDGITLSIPPGESIIRMIPSFTWPDTGSCGNAQWLAGMFSSDLSTVYGDIDVLPFDWGQ
ncbi:right-handed parallel beta-helix repeat-containing protein, partial [bacterium]|nr:right-handed parallel beta-helix repeat-containing protein [candidate division CSSED10-310 bacterium]